MLAPRGATGLPSPGGTGRLTAGISAFAFQVRGQRSKAHRFWLLAPAALNAGGQLLLLSPLAVCQALTRCIVTACLSAAICLADIISLF